MEALIKSMGTRDLPAALRLVRGISDLIRGSLEAQTIALC